MGDGLDGTSKTLNRMIVNSNPALKLWDQPLGNGRIAFEYICQYITRAMSFSFQSGIAQ